VVIDAFPGNPSLAEHDPIDIPTKLPTEETQERETASVDSIVVLRSNQPSCEDESAAQSPLELLPSSSFARGSSSVQEDGFQTLLATRLGQPGRRLRIQDVATAFQDIPGISVARRPSTVGESLDSYTGKHHSDFSALLELDALPSWTLKKREDAVDIYTHFDPMTGHACFKGVTEMCLAAQDGGIFYLMEHLLDAGSRPKWDDLCLQGETVEQCLPFYRVSYLRFKSPMPGLVSKRDVLIMGRFRFQADGTLILSMKSTTDDRGKPEVPEFVRLNFIRGGYIIRTTGKDTYQVSFMGSVDPMGWVPQFIKGSVCWRQALVLAKFKSRYKL